MELCQVDEDRPVPVQDAINGASYHVKRTPMWSGKRSRHWGFSRISHSGASRRPWDEACRDEGVDLRAWVQQQTRDQQTLSNVNLFIGICVNSRGVCYSEVYAAS